MGKKVARQGRKSKEIRFLRGERIDVGIDVHKKSNAVTLWSEQRDGVIMRCSMPADLAAVLRTLAPYKKRIHRVVYEAGPTGYGLARALRESGFCADVIAPSRTPKTTGQEAKSDGIDSRKLAMWSAKGLLRPVRVPTLEEEGDRQVFRARGDLVKKRRRVKQQIKSLLLLHGIEEPEGLTNWAAYGVKALGDLKLSPQLRLSLDLFLADLAHYDAQVRRVEAALAKLAGTARHKVSVRALKTVPGVGDVTAMAVCTELVDPKRFSSGREVAAMTGLAPLVSRTGQSVRGGPLMKCGNVRLRTLAIEAAWRFRARDPWAAATYARLVANTGEKKKAIAGLARRLMIVLWRIAVTGEDYRPPPVEEPSRTGPRSVGSRKRRQPGLADRCHMLA